MREHMVGKIKATRITGPPQYLAMRTTYSQATRTVLRKLSKNYWSTSTLSTTIQKRAKKRWKPEWSHSGLVHTLVPILFKSIW